MLARVALLVAALSLVATTPLTAQTRPPGVRATFAILDGEFIDASLLAEPLSLEDALKQLKQVLRQRGKELDITVNTNAFKDEAGDQVMDPNDAQVILRPVPRRLSIGQALTRLLDQVPTNNATYLARPGYVEVTTFARAHPAYLLGEPISARFEFRTVASIFDELFDRTGLPIVVDARYAHRMRTIVSAQFTHHSNVGTVVRVVTNMVDLKPIIIDNVIYVTTRESAERLLLEQEQHEPQSRFKYSRIREAAFAPMLWRSDASTARDDRAAPRGLAAAALAGAGRSEP